MILCGIEKHGGIGNSHDLRNYMTRRHNEKYIEEMSILAILPQIILIIEKFYLDKESDVKQLHCNLRKRIIAWLEVCNTEPENDNQQ